MASIDNIGISVSHNATQGCSYLRFSIRFVNAKRAQGYGNIEFLSYTDTHIKVRLHKGKTVTSDVRAITNRLSSPSSVMRMVSVRPCADFGGRELPNHSIPIENNNAFKELPKLDKLQKYLDVEIEMPKWFKDFYHGTGVFPASNGNKAKPSTPVVTQPVETITVGATWGAKAQPAPSLHSMLDNLSAAEAANLMAILAQKMAGVAATA